MSNEELLLVVLVLVYFSECFVLVSRRAVGIRTFRRPPGRFAIVHPSALFGNGRAGLIPVNPLPPLGAIYVSHAPAISLSPLGVYGFVSQNIHPDGHDEQPAQYLPWNAVQTVARDGKTLVINKKPFLDVGNEHYADHLCTILRSVAGAEPPKRSERIQRELDESTDIIAIQKIVTSFQEDIRTLRLLSINVFLTLFCILPWLLLTQKIMYLWPFFLGVLAALSILVTRRFAVLHKRYYPEFPAERWSHIAMMVLVPAALIRAADGLSTHLTVRFHPLAVAFVLCDRNRGDGGFPRFARRILLDLRRPLQTVRPGDGPEFIAAEGWFRDALRTHLEKFLADHLCPTDLVTLTAPPTQEGPDNLTYCPRCDEQYVLTAGDCSACKIPLVPFSTNNPVIPS